MKDEERMWHEKRKGRERGKARQGTLRKEMEKQMKGEENDP